MDVLIVDDNEELTAELHHILEGAGFGVFSAVTGDEAFRILRGQKIALLVTDLQLGIGEMDGLQLCREAKRIAPDVRCLMITGSRVQWDELAPLVDGLLTKPFNGADLLREVQALSLTGF